MAQMGMDIAAIEQNLTTLKSGADNLDSLTLEVSNLQGPLENAWEGQEAAACVEYLNKLSTKMQSMSDEIMKIHKWVEQTKTNYEETAAKGASAYSI